MGDLRLFSTLFSAGVMFRTKLRIRNPVSQTKCSKLLVALFMRKKHLEG